MLDKIKGIFKEGNEKSDMPKVVFYAHVPGQKRRKKVEFKTKW